MRKSFKHITKEERDLIAILVSQKKSIRVVGRQLGRSPSTILREIQRNRSQRGRQVYLPHKAQERANQTRKKSHKNKRLKSFSLQHDIEAMLMKKWSPKIIAGRLKRQGKDYACSESIYQWIYREAPHLIGFLPRTHPKRRQRRFKRARRVRIPNRISIQQRPAPASNQVIGRQT